MKTPDWLSDAYWPTRPKHGLDRTQIERLKEPLARFLHMEAAGGLLLLACTVIALIMANSPWAAAFTEFWQTPPGFTVGDFDLYRPLLLWINDGLMTIFFFLVGLEIKREFVFGELRDPRDAALPAAAALGGMIVPAALYLAFLKSGVHPTVVGVLLGLLTPAQAWFAGQSLANVADGVRRHLLQDQDSDAEPKLAHHHEAVLLLMTTARESISPLVRLESALHPWVAFGIVPLFALANAGGVIDLSAFADSVAVAVTVGLVVGKPLGIVTFSWLAVQLGFARLPTGVTWKVMVGAGCLAGIGFTMSLFIAGLALDSDQLPAGKIGTLFGSALSAALGMALLVLFLNRKVTYHGSKLLLRSLLFSSVCSVLTATVVAQEPVGTAGELQKPPVSTNEEISLAPAKVDVKPVARDEEIRQRLQSVLDATEWFIDPQVRVDEGVVFLNGRAETDDLRKWAGDLARNTQDVVAVANRIEVVEPSIWDFSAAWDGLLVLWRDFIRALPFFFFGLLILTLSAGAGVLATRAARTFLRRKVTAKLLRNVMARGLGVLVFLFGVYIILRVSGLTQLALTVVGGTGLIGLAVGIAFRDITENFLASIFLSMQRPFETGDLIEVTEVTGYVQQLNVRTTILMSLDGNVVQIPNASVYKSNICNFTTNANRREDFLVGIGYDDSINDAQETARTVLADHPAVLNDPEPSVLVDSLGSSTINLRVYFWLNGREHSWLKVRSSVIRLVKLAFQKHGISMPDEAREIVFPHGVPVTMFDGQLPDAGVLMPGKGLPPASGHEELAAVSTKAEAGLYSEAVVIEEQARQAQPLKDGENLLPVASGTRAAEKQTNEPQPER